MNEIDFNLINGPLNILYQDILAKIKKEPRDKITEHLASFCELFLIALNNNYHSVLCLVRNDYKFSGPSKVICRSSMDIVFTICLIMSNPGKYVPLYSKSGWRENKEAYLHERESEFTKTFGEGWLNEYDNFLFVGAELLSITDEEKENYEQSFSYFPTAPQMLKENGPYYNDFDSATMEMLRIIKTDYYKYLSQILHFAEPGLAVHVYPIIDEKSSENTKLILKSEPIAISMLSLLIMMSEINLTFGYDFNSKLKELWTYLAMTIPLHKEIYDAKYKSAL